MTLRVQLKNALKEKMQAHVDNLQLVTICKETEENNLKMLATLQELNEKFVKKSLKYQKCREEKPPLIPVNNGSHLSACWFPVGTEENQEAFKLSDSMRQEL